eukprot:GHUV01001820.1.p1 GENE.GHUV01001820.1~~GHUV01001820.1.p1  ORF type:complete len:274 (+),score=94.51 GHUV01001820.1:470-1291(+)
MASATTYLNITEQQVTLFLDTLLEKQTSLSRADTSGATVEVSGTAVDAPASSAAAVAAAAAPLRLHPRVDAVHPLGEAHTAQEVEAAIKLYKQIVKDDHFVIDNILVEPDKALVTGYQMVHSRLAALPSYIPLPHQIQHQLAGYLPSLTAGKVPTAIQLRFGKSDMGDPVVTHLSLSFSLLSVLLPHLALQPWQADILQEVKPQLIKAVLSAGSLASVVEDVGTSLGATWRATSAVLQATIGRVLGELKERLSSRAASRTQQAGTDQPNIIHA